MATHFCVRVYANGDARYSLRDDEGLKSWLDYNRLRRPGNALFVNGAPPDPAVDMGYLNEAQVALVSERLSGETAAMERMAPWKPEYDRSEGATIYPEKGFRRFEWPRRAPDAAEAGAAPSPLRP